MHGMGAAAQKLKSAAYLLAEKTTRGTIEKKGIAEAATAVHQ